jgi:hypothetical protein
MTSETEVALPGRVNWVVRLVLLFVVLSTAAVYSPVAGFDFVNYDDYSQILTKPLVRAGLTWEGLRWAFSGGHHIPPLAYVAHMIDVQLFGYSSTAHHLSNLLLHLVNVVLLFWALRRLTGDPYPSLFVAAAFALHPLNVESVAWVAEKKNLLSTLFWLAALGTYAAYARSGGAARYAGVVACLVLGLASKAMLVTLPFVFLLLDFWPLGRLRTRTQFVPLVVEKLPMFAICAVVSFLTIVTQMEAGSVRSLERLGYLPRVSNMLVSYVIYLRKMLWPGDLAPLYPHTDLIGLPLWSSLQALGALLLLGGISAFAWRQRRTQPFLLAGWFWFLGVLVPVIGIVQVGVQSMADRYMYMAMIGPLIMIGWGGRRMLLGWPHARYAFIAVGLLVVLAFGAATSKQVVYWKDTLALFERSIATTEDNWVAMNNVAWLLATCPNSDVRDGMRAVRIAEGAVALTSRRNRDLLDTLAAAYAEAGRFDQAINSMREAVELAAEAGSSGTARRFRRTLQQYERREPMRARRGCPSAAS